MLSILSSQSWLWHGRSCMHAPLPSVGQTSCCQGWQRRQHLHVDHSPFIQSLHGKVAPFIQSIHIKLVPFICIDFATHLFVFKKSVKRLWYLELGISRPDSLWGDSREVATAGRLIIVSPGSLLVLLLLLCLKDVGFEEAFWYKRYSRKTKMMGDVRNWRCFELCGLNTFRVLAWSVDSLRGCVSRLRHLSSQFCAAAVEAESFVEGAGSRQGWCKQVYIGIF